MDSINNFSLLGSTRSFSNRTKDIFGSLDVIEASHQTFLKDPSIHDDLVAYIKADPIEDTEKIVNPAKIDNEFISIYKKPTPIKRSIKKIVKRLDHKKDTSKWTHYNLADIPDVTEKSNRQVAEDLLFQKQKSKIVDEIDEPMETINASSKHIFRKPNNNLLSTRKNNNLNLNKLSWSFENEEDENDNSCLTDQIINNPINKPTFKTHVSKNDKSFRCCKYDEDDISKNLVNDQVISHSIKIGSNVMPNNKLNICQDSDSDDFSEVLEIDKDNIDLNEGFE